MLQRYITGIGMVAGEAKRAYVHLQDAGLIVVLRVRYSLSIREPEHCIDLMSKD